MCVCISIYVRLPIAINSCFFLLPQLMSPPLDLYQNGKSEVEWDETRIQLGREIVRPQTKINTGRHRKAAQIRLPARKQFVEAPMKGRVTKSNQLQLSSHSICLVSPRGFLSPYISQYKVLRKYGPTLRVRLWRLWRSSSSSTKERTATISIHIPIGHRIIRLSTSPEGRQWCHRIHVHSV